MDLLELRNITKYYGNFKANDDINLTIKKGTIHAIIGENGAGKSTLMNILAGVVIPSTGEILINGKVVDIKNPNDSTDHGIGMVQQEFMLYDQLTIVENIVMGYEDVKSKFFLDLQSSRKKIEKLCTEYRFDLPLNQKIRDVPLAVQQQVEIVKVLYKNADIIILDEPTAILTPQGIEGLFKAMRHLIGQGKTIIFITHKLKEVLEVSDYISVLKDGKHINTFKNENITEEDLATAMVGRKVFLEIERKKVVQEEKIFEVNNLSVRDERGIEKVKNVSFSIRKGEIIGVVGVANNGQNELIEALVGMRNYHEGIIKLNGKELEKNNPRAIRLSKIGYVPQDRIRVGSSPISSIVENAIMGKHISSFNKSFGMMDWQGANEYSDSILNEYNVKYRSKLDPISSLSGGNMQKLIVGREFTQNNEFIIVEDPVRGIDIGSIEFIWNEITNQVEQHNHSVLLVTYDLNEAMTLSDRILIMYDGSLVKMFERKDFDEYEIGMYMLGGKNDESEYAQA